MRGVVLVATASVALACGSAQAAPDRLAYFGGLRIVGVSTVCKTQEIARVGDAMAAVFQRDLRNGQVRDNLRLSFGLADYTFLPKNTAGQHVKFGSSGLLDGTYIFSRGNAGSLSGKYSSIDFSPDTFDVNTPALKITGKLANFDEEGCVVTFQFQGSLLP